jgi:uncharacterized protein (TIGR02301 family)
MSRIAIGLMAMLLVAAPAAQAQQRGSAQPSRPAAPSPAQPQQPAPAQPEPPSAPYEKELLRLAEVMGSLAFLRSLCSAADAAEWPRRMQALIETEGTSPGRKERLAGAYNRGYRGFSITYRVCTPSAAEATARYLKEGETLSRGIAGRFGG